ncbi:MAG: DNA-directed RNA polymerase beta' subunit [Candidatus Jettenia ecosi]|uniref:DNA-directed RNA polymerase subunit n=1 Tax=Candidatus Jettenia ecosi TaxID=2494326 RepID=A0A533Q6G1_9BACT|nr:MAG: DNA-directed RNA polymerase beta' subunit [Candidatus Jettenia ecosi]
MANVEVNRCIELSPHLDSYAKFVRPVPNKDTTLSTILSSLFPIGIPGNVQPEIVKTYTLTKRGKNKILGSAIANDILDPNRRTAITQAYEIIDEQNIEKLLAAGVKEVAVLNIDNTTERDEICQKLREIKESNGNIDILLLKKEILTEVNYDEYELEKSSKSEDYCFLYSETLNNTIKLKLKMSMYTQWSYDGVDIYHRQDDEKEIHQVLGSIPAFTERSSFIVNGLERVPIAQIIPAYGLLVESNMGTTYTAWIRPKRGLQVRFTVQNSGENRGIIKIDIANICRQLDLAYFLKAFDLQKEADDLFRNKDLYKKNYLEVYQNVREPLSQEQINFVTHYLCCSSRYDLSSKGRERLNNKLAKSLNDLRIIPPRDNILNLTKGDILEIINYLLNLVEGLEGYEPDDSDSLANQEVLLIGDQLEKVTTDALSKIKQTLEKDTGGKRFNYENSLGKMPAIFNGYVQGYINGELCQLLDQNNSLSEISHKRKITFYGPKGLSKDYRGFDKRDVHYSHYGRICLVETPESEKIGLTLHLAAHARIEDGQIKTPYVPTNQTNANLCYLNPSEEENTAIFPYSDDNEVNKNQYFARRGNDGMIRLYNRSEVRYHDAYSSQCIGLAAALIPFIQHDDANRVLMGAKNLKQSLPLLYPERPLVRTGFEKEIAHLSGRCIKAKSDGEVIAVTPKEIVIQCDDDWEKESYSLMTETPTIHETIMYHKSCVRPGAKVVSGQIIADGADTKDGELALGTNLLVAYMPWYGYNFEDGIVISDRLVKEDILTSVHVKEKVIGLEENEIAYYERKGTSLREINTLTYLTKDGIIAEDTDVLPGTVLVRKYRNFETDRDKGKRPIKIKGKNYANEPIDERADHNTRGKVIKSEKVCLDGKEQIRIWIKQQKRITVGDKLMGRHGNKGVVSRIVPVEDMPKLEDGTPVDVILNPHGVISRMNLGQIIETHLGLILKKKGMPSALVKPFEQYDRDNLKKELEDIGFPEGKAILLDGKTGKRFESPVVVGYQYIVKLNHLAEEKLHSRLTGSYDPILQQPPHGKRRNGGQRLGEMEVWALLAHKAFVLAREFLSVKSDDIKGREDVFKELVEHGFKTDTSLLSSCIPESFRIFLTFLKGLGAKPTIHLKDGDRTIDNVGFLSAIKAEDVRDLSVVLADSDEVRKWGMQVSESRFQKKRIYGELSCGCKGDFNQILIYQNPLICRKHGRSVVLECGCEGNLIEIAEVICQDHTHKLQCKNHKDKIIKKPKVVDEGISCILWKKEDIGFADDGIFSERIFGKNDDFVRRDRMGILELASEMGHPLSRKPEGGYTLTIKCLPVIPPELRPFLADKKYVSELNKLYQRVINQNNRLEEILSQKSRESDTAERIKTELQKRIDELMIDGWQDKRAGRRYRSLMDMLSGKYGLFRQVMLGKRVNASGRAVIVPSPSLSINQMELPYEIAVTLFEPWLENQLVKDYTIPPSQAGKWIKQRMQAEYRKKVKESIQKFVDGNNLVVLLNRPPTLHKYNLMAFTPLISDNAAIGIHPLVCAGYNADFDGDQMSVFLPWIGQKEAREKLSPLNNILSSANGRPLPNFSQDIVAGLFLADGWKKGRIHAEIKRLHLDTEKREEFANTIQTLMKRGFDKATTSALTFSIFDLDNLSVSRKDREDILQETLKTIHPDGKLLDRLEKEEKERIYDVWKARVKDEIQRKLNSPLNLKNPVAVMILSGARGDLDTLTQLSGMRGLMEKPGGGYIDEPIISNFMEGLSPLEFFISTHGSRKTLVDKKLKVADAGDFTRRMVHSAFDLIVTEHDCGTTEGIVIENRDPEAGEGVSRRDMIAGRIAMEDVAEADIRKGQVITESHVEKLKTSSVPSVKVRSILTCKSSKGVCQQCYGWELSQRVLPDICLPVGIIAAQSIGERGTQLSMRTFHTGGIKGEDITRGLPRVKNIFEKGKSLEDKLGEDKDMQGNLLAFLLKEMHRIYKGEIDDKHFEVILKTMIKDNKIVGITQSAISNEDFLASASFQKARSILKKAVATGSKTAFSGLRQSIIIGGRFN